MGTATGTHTCARSRRGGHDLRPLGPHDARADPDGGGDRHDRRAPGQLAGGPRDQFIQQQVQALSEQLNSLTSDAATSLVDGAVLASRAGDFGVSVTEAEVDAAEASRKSLPERLWTNLILIDPLPEDADPDAEPTEEQIAAATEEAQAALSGSRPARTSVRSRREVSDDPSAELAASIGWFDADDPAYAEYFERLADADAGDIVGPVEIEGGVAVLQLVQRREARTTRCPSSCAPRA